MRERCGVERDNVVGANHWGQPGTSRITLHPSLACTTWTATETELADGVRLTTRTQEMMRVPKGTDLRPLDIVYVGGETYEVETVIDRSGYRLAGLSRTGE